MQIRLTITVSDHLLHEAEQDGETETEVFNYYVDLVKKALIDDGGSADITYIGDMD